MAQKKKKTPTAKGSLTSASRSKADSRNKKIAAGVGLGIAAAAAAATGAYLLTGKQGAKNRKEIKSWAAKAEKEIKRQFNAVKDRNQSAYDAVVDKVVKGYKELKNVDQNEIVAMVKELRGHWNTIQREFAGAKTSLKKRTKPAASKSKRK